MEPRNRFQGMNSASLCSLAGRYDNPMPKFQLWAVSGVFQNIDPPAPLHPATVSSPRTKGEGYTLAGRWGGGGSIFWKTPDIGLASWPSLRGGVSVQWRDAYIIVFHPKWSKLCTLFQTDANDAKKWRKSSKLLTVKNFELFLHFSLLGICLKKCAKFAPFLMKTEIYWVFPRH